MIIAITGTPGSGKTTLSKELAKELKYKYFDLTQFIKKNKLYESYDKELDTLIVNIRTLSKTVKEHIKDKKNIIIDSHLSHLLPKKIIDLCIVVTCINRKKLKQRLIERKYSEQKINDNLEAEIFEVCLTEAQEKKHIIITIDGSKKFNIKKIVKEIKEKKP